MIAMLGHLRHAAGDSVAWRQAVASLGDRASGPTLEASVGTAWVAYRGQHPGGFARTGAVAILLDGQASRAGGSEWLTGLDVAASVDKQGDTLFEGLDGCFAMAVVDEGGARAQLYRDSFGTRPLYFAQLHGDWVFASEVGMLLAAGVAPRLERKALASLVHFRFLAGPTTVFAGISLVPPGALVTLRPGLPPEIRLLRPPRRNPRSDGTLEDSVQRAGDALDASMDALANLAEVVAIPLSGGIDSSLVAALAKPRFRKCIGYSAVVEGFDNPELDRAREVAARLGIEHKVVTVTGSDVSRLYPLIVTRLATCPRHFNNFVVARLYEAMAADSVEAVLQGDSADSLFSSEGTRELELFRQRQRLLHRIPAIVRRPLADLLSGAASPRLRRAAAMMQMSYDEAQIRLPAADVLGPFTASPASMAVAENITGGFRLDEELRELSLALADGHDAMYHGLSIVVVGGAQTERNDRLATRHGLRLLYPFHDPMVQQVGLELPLRLRELDGVAKPVLRQLAAERLGPDVAGWSKMGFPSPEAAWMTGPLGLHLRAVFEPNAFLDALAPVAVRRRLSMPQDRQLIWTLMTLHSLHTIFGLDHG